MARREYSHSPRCANEGCRERAYYVFKTRREYDESVKRLRADGGWRCSRHSQPDRVLTPESPVKTMVLTNTLLHWESRYEGRQPLGLFWVEEGKTTGSGFTFGPGFKAHSDDFPEGATLTVTATVEVPDA